MIGISLMLTEKTVKAINGISFIAFWSQSVLFEEDFGSLLKEASSALVENLRDSIV